MTSKATLNECIEVCFSVVYSEFTCNYDHVVTVRCVCNYTCNVRIKSVFMLPSYVKVSVYLFLVIRSVCVLCVMPCVISLCIIIYVHS